MRDLMAWMTCATLGHCAAFVIVVTVGCRLTDAGPSRSDEILLPYYRQVEQDSAAQRAEVIRLRCEVVRLRSELDGVKIPAQQVPVTARGRCRE